MRLKGGKESRGDFFLKVMLRSNTADIWTARNNSKQQTNITSPFLIVYKNFECAHALSLIFD